MAEHAGLIPIGQAARLLMISEERIRQLVKQGFIPRPEKRGFVQLVGAVQGYLRYLKDDERRSASRHRSPRAGGIRSLRRSIPGRQGECGYSSGRSSISEPMNRMRSLPKNGSGFA